MDGWMDGTCRHYVEWHTLWHSNEGAEIFPYTGTYSRVVFIQNTVKVPSVSEDMRFSLNLAGLDSFLFKTLLAKSYPG